MILVLSRKRKLTVNQNLLAEAICMMEGKKQALSIAQVKEVLRIALDLLGRELESNPKGTLELLRRRKG
ncbi:MAG TPA: hypothetical protein PK082_10895 [Phycisphaerae bacterium]|nr:hypothetical protein [Phycisphaerae bacterium]